ncbi:type II toxin-antitoxin system prevent-host-death family antitoxin [Kosakonia sp. BYX6]|uniref:Type II toxin-antitoxin system prevent-host-death family antitoxin n=1 Tax=Kosakonia calanthes TaxID=3139408 RepID=A0ABZ3B9Y1_9ENTR
MQTINSRTARQHFSATLNAATAAPIEITRSGGVESVVWISKREYETLKHAAGWLVDTPVKEPAAV